MLTPLPGTVDFNRWEEEMAAEGPTVNGIPLTRYWLISTCGQAKDLYSHPVMSADEVRRRTQHAWDLFYSLRSIWGRSHIVGTVRERLTFVLISKLYRQMYANTGSPPTAPGSPSRRGGRDGSPSPCSACFRHRRCPIFRCPTCPDALLRIGEGGPSRTSRAVALHIASQPSMIDLGIVVAYFVIIFVIGLRARADAGVGPEEYFLSSRSLRWPSIAVSTIATNISASHFLSVTGAAYVDGLAQANFELNAIFGIVIAAFFFIPLYLRLRVVTISQFFEQRFGPKIALVYAILMIVLYALLYLGTALFWAAFALDGSSPTWWRGSATVRGCGSWS